MALEAGFVDGTARDQTAGGELGLRIVAIAAGEVMALVNGSRPKNSLPAVVAVLALCVLDGHRRLAAMGEANDARRIGGVAEMGRAGSVTRLAFPAFQLVARIER